MNKLVVFCFAMTVMSLIARSEDIELYVGDNVQRSSNRPQVLIIFDTSGSMTTSETIKVEYDVNDHDFSSDGYVYYSADDSVPQKGDYRRFPITENNCASSFNALVDVGFYIDKFMRYNSSRYKWNHLRENPNNSTNYVYVDCLQDVATANKNNASGVITGLPSNDTVDLVSAPPYGNNPQSTAPFSKARTLYSSHYIDWYHNAPSDTKSRLAIAKDTITDLIESAPGVSFALEVFNKNYSSSDSGGRIAYGLKDEADYNSATLVNLIDDEVYASGWTPLCESLYEASLYFGGKKIKFGDLGGSRVPKKDTSIQGDPKYVTPYSGCSNEIFVILMTDGEPTKDTGADSYVNSLISGGSGNRLDELAKWMHENDINDNLPGRQFATIFTIGFGKDAVNNAGVLLNDTANNGGGKYYPAQNPGDLLSSLQSALLEILNINTSFTAPSVASNNFDRTETLDSVYYAMFVPEQGPSWQGNLKKLRVVNGVQVDRDNVPAITADGIISKDAKTIWTTSATPDGNDVKVGGVAEMLRSQTIRNVFSDIAGTGSTLDKFTLENVKNYYETETALATELGVAAEEIDVHLNWALGKDVDDDDDDGSVTDNRPNVFGDPLHSKPLVINYGGASVTQQDVRIIIGTNAGALHMFQDEGTAVNEIWAFMPKEFFSNIKGLRENQSSTTKIYGIDGPATSYLFDENGDGVIDPIDDKAWVFFGLRRGGSSYYALDVTQKDVPKLLWHIDASTNGFSRLGQSWSQPKVGYSKINSSSGKPKPVLIFGGGYSTAKDNSGVGADADTVGTAIYMIDAETGTLLWSATPDAKTTINTQVAGFKNSIPSSVAVLDSDSDGLIDRIYTGDTGGNVWRVDMPGSNPFSSSTPWTVFKLASLGGDSNSVDRRFFSEPSIVRTFITDTIKIRETTYEDAGSEEFNVIHQERPYEAILIGSGDRSTPTGVDTDDRFFMIKDAKIVTESYDNNATTNDPDIPYTVSDLYDYTDNPFGEFTEPLDSTEKAALEALQLAVGLKKGWYYDYTSSGEKSTAPGIAINGVAYFTSFSPAASNEDTDSCVLSDGVGHLYAIDLALGTTVHNWRKTIISPGIPDTPSVIITKDPVIDPPTQPDTDAPPGEKSGTIKLLAGKIISLDISLKTSRTFLYIKEDY